MTIASKTVLVQMRFIRAGAPFCDIGSNPAIVTDGEMDFVRLGTTFFGVSNVETPPVYPSNAFPIRNGSPFDEVTGNPTYDSSFTMGRIRMGQNFVVPFSGTTVYPTQIPFPVRSGSPWNDAIAKSTIDASEFDFVRLGAPYWHTFSGGPPPVTYNATQFFMLF